METSTGCSRVAFDISLMNNLERKFFKLAVALFFMLSLLRDTPRLTLLSIRLPLHQSTFFYRIMKRCGLFSATCSLALTRWHYEILTLRISRVVLTMPRAACSGSEVDEASMSSKEIGRDSDWDHLSVFII